ncbi:Uncharacterised protein [Mycobacteroides abscessus subsp. bolletii]|uniref:hypothetical protein n=1 Tax=Mycobacteroides abscessus TaxID=36809 RepID=UPI0009A568F9|nr:hypothetical protein [Mycobacteroides abscessus]SKS73314.1 Uncharacterised protein [Mycobacteroides abscessus subsp. bolletii]SKS83486.1 Uncharacterised protein [Mycobacteroides abscessus subsp. bolletii]
MDEVLRCPAAVDTTHLGVGDEVTGYHGGPNDISVIVDPVPDSDGYVAIARGEYQCLSRIDYLVHAQGCAACDEFTKSWRAQKANEWEEFRQLFCDKARALADTLRHSALTSKLHPGEDGDSYTLTLSPAAPLPGWLHDALAGAHFDLPEGAWPNWGRTQHPADWVTLITEHPEVLVPDHGMLKANGGATWPAIAEAFTYARTLDPGAYMDVTLWVETDGRISVEPAGMYTDRDLPPDVADRIDQILIGGGRDADLIHHPKYAPALNSWTLNA